MLFETREIVFCSNQRFFTPKWINIIDIMPVNPEIEISKRKEDFLTKGYKQILDNLPFAITVQETDTQIIVYENKKAIELIGSYLHKPCFSRWSYIEGWGKKTCEDCALIHAKQDSSSHQILRKTIDKEGKEIFLEIKIIPIKEILNEEGNFRYYIEMVSRVDVKDEKAILHQKELSNIVNELILAIVQFGNLGAEPLIYENLDFLKENENINIFLNKLTVYIFTGIYQGIIRDKELYGPVPVLDKGDILAHIFAFSLKNEKAEDKRKRGLEPCLMYIFYPREYTFLFKAREKIEDFLAREFERVLNIENITEEFLVELRERFNICIIDNYKA